MIRERPETEIRTSEEFTKKNFGLKIADEYPEIVRELCRSELIGSRLILGLVAWNLLGQNIFKEFKSPGDIGTVILNNVEVFETPLAMLYWGIQIGRKLERESAETLRNIESNE